MSKMFVLITNTDTKSVGEQMKPFQEEVNIAGEFYPNAFATWDWYYHDNIETFRYDYLNAEHKPIKSELYPNGERYYAILHDGVWFASERYEDEKWVANEWYDEVYDKIVSTLHDGVELSIVCYHI